MKIRGLVFDVDGTLLDSCSVHFEIYQRVFGTRGIDLTRETFFRTYSPNWYETYRELGIPSQAWPDLDRAWLEESGNHHAPAFPGVAGTLRRLGRDYRLGIFTSGSRSRVEGELRHSRLLSFFQVIVTGDDVTHPKPAPQGLRLVLERMALAADQALYIGDAQADLTAARQAGVGFVGVRSDFDAFDADITPDLEGITQLPEYLRARED